MQMSDTIPAAPLKELAATVFSRKKSIVAALVIPPILAAGLVFIWPPTYRADTELMVRTGHEYLPTSEGDGQPTGPTATKQEAINSEVELLMSRAVAQEVIDKIGLKNLYPEIIDDPPWFGSIQDAAIKKFQKSVHVEPVKLSNVIDVTYDADDPQTASKVLDTLIGVYLAKHTQVYATGQQQGYRETMAHDLADLQGLEQQRSRIKLENHIYDIAPQRAALIQQRVDAETHLQDAIDRRDTLQQRIAALSKAAATVPATVKSTETDHSFQMDHARDALTDLKETEASMANRYAPENPELVQIRKQIAAIQAQSRGLGGGLKVIVQPTQLSEQVQQELVMDRVELAPLNDEVARYQQLIAGYGRQLDQLERGDTALRVNQAQIDSLEGDAQSLRQRLDQARTQDEIDKARMTSVVQIAPAMTPDKPEMPKPLLFVAAGVILGILSASGIVLLTLMTRRTFYTEIGLERRLGLPVLASLDHVTLRRGQKALIAE